MRKQKWKKLCHYSRCSCTSAAKLTSCTLLRSAEAPAGAPAGAHLLNELLEDAIDTEVALPSLLLHLGGLREQLDE
jgi:hypothetical protein